MSENADPRRLDRGQPVFADEWLTLGQLSAYSKISMRQLKRFVARAEDYLPHARNGRRILVLRSKFDTWLEAQGQRRPVLMRSARSFHEIMSEVKNGRATERRRLDRE